MVAYTKRQAREKENESLRGGRDKTEFMDFRFEGEQAAGFGKGRREQEIQ